MIRGFLMVMAFIFWHGYASGDIYRYINDRGAPSFTNDTSSIPLKHKKGAVLISKDEMKPQMLPTDQTVETVLPEKEEASYKADTSSVRTPLFNSETSNSPYINIAIMAGLFIGTLISAVFVSNGTLKKILNMTSLAAMITLLVYISTVFFSKHMHKLKEDALEMTDAMKKKEAQKEKALQDMSEDEQSRP